MSPLVEILRRRALPIILICAIPTLPVGAAEERLLTGALGRWLSDSAAPELAEALGRHPRFKGEVIRIVAMRNGKPDDAGNRPRCCRGRPRPAKRHLRRDR